MSKTEPQALRLLVSASTFCDAAEALRLVGQLPDLFRENLGGVLIEDVDTLAAYQIPGQRVVLINGTTALAPDLSQVRMFLKADARAFQKSLAHMAGSKADNWVFAQDRGELVGTALRAATGWDILVIGHRQIHKIAGKVVVLKGSNQKNDSVKEMSDRLSQRLGADQIVFSVGTEADAEGVQFETLEQALSALARTNAQAVLVDLNQGPVHTTADIARLLDCARCPLFVFGASGMTAMLEHNAHMPPSPESSGSDG